jgi:hypothetical protein
MFYAPELVLDDIEGVRSCFLILRSRNRFRRYRGRWVPFSYFALPESFSAVSMASGPRFWPYLRRSRAPFSCFALLDSFSAVSRASGPVFIFYVPVLIFGGSEGVGSRFYALRYPDSFLAVSRALGLIFIFCAPELIFGDTELCQVPFSCFSLPDTFSAVRRASSPVFMFCAPVLFFSGSDGLGSRFHVLRPRTRFQRYLGRRVPFS